MAKVTAVPVSLISCVVAATSVRIPDTRYQVILYHVGYNWIAGGAPRRFISGGRNYHTAKTPPILFEVARHPDFKTPGEFFTWTNRAQKRSYHFVS